MISACTCAQALLCCFAKNQLLTELRRYTSGICVAPACSLPVLFSSYLQTSPMPESVQTCLPALHWQQPFAIPSIWRLHKPPTTLPRRLLPCAKVQPWRKSCVENRPPPQGGAEPATQPQGHDFVGGAVGTSAGGERPGMGNINHAPSTKQSACRLTFPGAAVASLCFAPALLRCEPSACRQRSATCKAVGGRDLLCEADEHRCSWQRSADGDGLQK